MLLRLPFLALLALVLMTAVGFSPMAGGGPSSNHLLTTTGVSTGGTTGGSTGTSGTTGATTGSSGGASAYAPGTEYTGSSAYEYKAQSSYVSNGGSTATYSSHHVCRLDIAVGSIASTISVTYGGSTYTATLNSSTSGYFVAIADPNGIGSITGVTSSAYRAGNVVVTGHDSASPPNPTFAHGVDVAVAPGTVVPLDLCGTGPLSGSSPQASVTLVQSYSFTDSGGHSHSVTDATYWMFNLNYVKNLCDDASIDTRKQFGQPDSDGHTPGDANGSLRPVNFGSWVYNGGLFVGNIAYFNKDQSEVSRVQLWVNSGGTTGTYKAGCVSLLDMGFPSRPSVSGELTVGDYVPSTTSSSTESNATWANRFAIDTSSAGISTVTFPSSNTNDYFNWQLGTGGPVSQVALAMAGDEATGGGVPFSGCWRYFASKEYAADHTSGTFPINDCRPRVWTIGESNLTIWFSDVVS